MEIWLLDRLRRLGSARMVPLSYAYARIQNFRLGSVLKYFQIEACAVARSSTKQGCGSFGSRSFSPVGGVTGKFWWAMKFPPGTRYRLSRREPLRQQSCLRKIRWNLNYAKANGLEAQFKSMEAGTDSRVEEEAAFLRSHTILETLELMNSESNVAESVAEYYAYVPFGEPYEYASPDLIARWFERNIRIYSNIRSLITSLEDRILVVYGAGHLGWLRQSIENDATVQLRTLSDLIASTQ